MKSVLQVLYVLLTACFAAGCSGSSNESKVAATFTHVDSLWLPFEAALDAGDRLFLTEHSLPQITCEFCNCGDSATCDATFIWQNCLPKFRHLDVLKGKGFWSSLDSVANEVIIHYTVQARMAEDGAYDLFFILKRQTGKYYLKEMFVT